MKTTKPILNILKVVIGTLLLQSFTCSAYIYDQSLERFKINQDHIPKASAPRLEAIKDVVIHPLDLNPHYHFRNGFQVGTLLSYIEKQYNGRQFTAQGSNFSLNRNQFGIAITSIESPDSIHPLLSIGGDEFLYSLYSSTDKTLVRLIEPHQRISFRDFRADSTKPLEVKVTFRLWDLSERDQTSPFNFYKVDKVGSTSPFSVQKQEVTFLITSTDPEQKPPYWSSAKSSLNSFNLKLEDNSSFIIKAKDLISDRDGESRLRDQNNTQLGLAISKWDSKAGQIYIRYSSQHNWINITDRYKTAFLSMNAELKIDFEEGNVNKNKKRVLHLRGWDGATYYKPYSYSKETRSIEFYLK